MVGIFVSYRRSDSLGIAARIHNWLDVRLAPNSVFMDASSITPGQDFRASIERAMARATMAFVVIGPNWLGLDSNGARRIDDPNDFLRIEFEIAIQKNLLIVPLLVNGSTLPPAHELPHSIASLAYRQTYVVRSLNFAQDMFALARAIGVYNSLCASTPKSGMSPSRLRLTEWATSSRSTSTTTQRPANGGRTRA
jgi:hypothetical protein